MTQSTAQLGFDVSDFIPIENESKEESFDELAELDRQVRDGQSPSVATAMGSILGKKRKLPYEADAIGRRWRRGIENQSVKTPWHKPIQTLRRSERPEVARFLHREIQNYVRYITPNKMEIAARRFAVHRVFKCLKRCIDGLSWRVFGSCITELDLPTSDIDLVIYSSTFTVTPKSLRKAARELLRGGAVAAGSLKVIAHARVPILKLKEKFTGIPIDISFNIESGIESLDSTKRLLSEHSAARTLIIILKHFLSMRGLNEPFTGGLGSYAVTCMVISFLQMHPFLQAHQIRGEDNLGVLFCELLELYGKNFNYDSVGIAIEGTGLYYPRAESNDIRQAMLLIRDPTDPENNVSKASRKMGVIRSALSGAFDILSSKLCEVNEMIEAQIHRRGAEPQSSVNVSSILSSIIWMEPEVLNFRRNIEEIFELHHLEDYLDDEYSLNNSDTMQRTSFTPRVPKVSAENGIIIDNNESHDVMKKSYFVGAESD